MNDYLDVLEAESISILRETAAQFNSAAILFSGGKDSTVIAHLARKAFTPGPIPFIFLHVDTGHNFPETLEFRDEVTKKLGVRLEVRMVQDSIDQGKAKEPKGPNASRNALQSVTLLDAILELKLNAVIGGARRDEEKARAKERIFSVRDEFGQWDPRNQRPELWQLFNGKLRNGEHMRVFPLSNWTELDIWNYIRRENIELPSVYFSHNRKCIRKENGTLFAHCEFIQVAQEDRVEELVVRCRTVGDMTCTGLVESRATTLSEIIAEVIAARTTERGSRMDDKVSESAMEDRKKQGYF